MVEKVHLLLHKRYCQQSEILSAVCWSTVSWVVGGEGCWGVGNYNIISINKEFVDRLDGKLPFLITEIWGESIHTNVWYRY